MAIINCSDISSSVSLLPNYSNLAELGSTGIAVDMAIENIIIIVIITEECIIIIIIVMVAIETVIIVEIINTIAAVKWLAKKLAAEPAMQ